MPRIREYQLRDRVSGPVETRRLSAEDIGFGSGLQAFGRGVSQVGNVVTRSAEQSEISDLNKKFSEAQAQFSNRLQETLRTADPNNKNLAEDFMREYDDHISQLREGVSTGAARNYYNRAQAQQRSQLFRSAVAGQSDLAGVKAKTDYLESLGNYSSSLLNDPSSYQFTSQMHSDAIDGLVQSGGLSTEDALKLKVSGKRELARNAVRGWINLDPEFAKEQLNGGKWDSEIDGDLKKQLLSESDQAIRGAELEKRRQEQRDRELLKQKQMVTQNDFLAKMEAGELTTKDILNSNLDAFGSGSKQQFLRMLDQETKTGRSRMRTDPGTFRSLFDRIHADDEDPNKILDENTLNQYLGRGLNYTDLNRLRAEVQGRRTQDGSVEAELKKGVSQIAKSSLTKTNPMLGIRDPEGDAQYQKFMNFFLTEYSRLRREGKSAQELLDPSSPDYLGKNIGQYTRSPQQIMRSLVNQVRTPENVPPAEKITPRQEGESAADYLKRIGK